MLGGLALSTARPTEENAGSHIQKTCRKANRLGFLQVFDAAITSNAMSYEVLLHPLQSNLTSSPDRVRWLGAQPQHHQGHHSCYRRCGDLGSRWAVAGVTAGEVQDYPSP